MINNDSVIKMICKNYPDITEEDAVFLARRTLSWLTIIGNTAMQRIADAKEAHKPDWETRAIILATSVVSRMFSGFTKSETEIESLNTLVDWLLTVDQNFGSSV